jgi:hypothetical protein
MRKEKRVQGVVLFPISRKMVCADVPVGLYHFVGIPVLYGQLGTEQRPACDIIAN